MGGKIPRNLKTKVIRQWLHGLTREIIAKEGDIGAGTVTAIIQDARRQEEYNDIDLLRPVSVKLKEEGLELPLLGFAIRLRMIMQENGITEEQIELIVQGFATQCLRHNISLDKLFQSGREALYLEEKFGVSVEKIPEYIIQGEKTIGRLEDQRQEILRQERQAREERDTIVAELERYGKEIPSIKRIKELETELDKAKKLNENYETWNRGLTKELADARHEAATLEGDGIDINARWKDTTSRLSLCLNELDKLKKKNRQINQSLH